MPPLDFPATPPNGTNYTGGMGSWTWDGVKWNASTSAIYVPISGATMTGPLILSADPTVTNGAATKHYVDTHGGVVTVSDTAPASPNPGALWFDSVGGQLYISYTDPNSTQWLIANSGAVGSYLALSGGILSGGLTINQNVTAPTVPGAGTPLYVIGPDGNNAIIQADAYVGTPELLGRKANGTAAAPTAVANANGLLLLLGQGYNGASFVGGASILAYSTQPWTSTANGTAISFTTTANGNASGTNSLILQGNVATFSGSVSCNVAIPSDDGGGSLYFYGNVFGNGPCNYTAGLYYGSGTFKYLSGAASSTLQMSGGGFQFSTAPSGTAGTAATLTQVAGLDSTGHLTVSNQSAYTDNTTASFNTVAGSDNFVRINGARQWGLGQKASNYSSPGILFLTDYSVPAVRMSFDANGYCNIYNQVNTNNAFYVNGHNITPGQIQAASGQPGTVPAHAGNCMQGLGFTFTPQSSTRVLAVITGSVVYDANNTTGSAQLRYGTGAAPAHGAASTGTQINFMQVTTTTNVEQVPCTLIAIATGLTIGTTYWFDVFLSTGSTTGDYFSCCYTFLEV